VAQPYFFFPPFLAFWGGQTILNSHKVGSATQGWMIWGGQTLPHGPTRANPSFFYFFLGLLGLSSPPPFWLWGWLGQNGVASHSQFFVAIFFKKKKKK
jgi:hypothetical protein